MPPTDATIAKRLSAAVFASWAVLCALQYGWIPLARNAWAVNLWAYYPAAVGVALAAVGFSVVFANVRERLGAVAGRVSARPGNSRLVEVGIGIVAAIAFWLARDNEISPDAHIFGAAVLTGRDFFFPDVGASWMIFGLMRIASALSLPLISLVQVMSCAAGGVVVAVLTSMARRGMLGQRRSLGLATGLLLSGGIVRVFAGRVESYALLLAAVAVYIWLALAYLECGRGWYRTCLAAGVAIWLHAASICLLLGLVLLPRLRSPRLDFRGWLRLVVRGMAAAAVPGLVFLAAATLIGESRNLDELVERALEVLGQSDAGQARRWWVRGWGGAPSIGTDFVFLSTPHLKFLANAVFLLCPAGPPVLVVLFAWRGATLCADTRVRFLLAMVLPLVVYTLALRPFWGPYDWDLFSMTAFVVILLQVLALELITPPVILRQVAVWLIVFQLLFVGAPFLGLRAESARDAGPFFTEGYMSGSIREPATPPPPALAPWL